MAVFIFIMICIGVIVLINNINTKGQNQTNRTIEKSIDLENNKNSFVTDFSHTEPISCEKKIKSAIPDANGLYPHEILMLHYASTYFPNEKNSFQEFWRIRYGVFDCENVLKSLVARGFIKIEVNTLLNLQSQTTLNLKTFLKDNKLPTSGKKEDLINRIIENIDEDKFPNTLKKMRYVLTDSAKKSMDESEYILYFHSHFIEELDIWKLNRLLNTEPKSDYKNTIGNYLIKKSKEHLENKDFGLYRNCKLNLFNLLYEQEDYHSAYILLLEVIYLDINTYLDNNFGEECLQSNLEYFFSCQIMIPDKVMELMDKIQEKLYVSNEKLKEDFIEEWSKYHFPISVFNVKQCADIYFYQKENNEIALNKILLSTKKKFLK